VNDTVGNHMSAIPAISLDAVSHQYTTDGGQVPTLQRVSLSFKKHEFVAVLGPSGCGKSTLLRLTAGLISPSEGNVNVFGTDLRGPRDEIGIVFQQPTLLPWATTEDNIVFPAKHKRGRVSTTDRQRARELITTTGLEGFEHRLPNALSGGMQQRVGIARALFLDPDILLMDEPFSALDALTRDAMGFELLQLWQASPKTVLFITHSIPEAVLLADRIIVLSERPGKVVADYSVPLGRPRTETDLRSPEVLDFIAELRALLIKRKVA